MIEWYVNDELGIFFDHKPNNTMLSPEDGKTQEEKDIIAKYPFINNTALRVELIDNIKQLKYEFTVTKNFRWDGATIPFWAWWIIGSKENAKFKNPSMIHDYICNNKGIVNFDRQFSSKVLRAMLEKAGVCKWRRNLMYIAVDLYQKTQGWGK